MSKVTEDLFPAGAAFVAGGTGALGSAICRGLAEAGADVAFTYRSSPAKAEALVAELQALGRAAMGYQADLSESSAVAWATAQAIDRFSRLHSVVYAAGPPIEFQYIHQIDSSEWRRVILSDICGCFNLVEATLAHLRDHGGGSYLALTTAAVGRPPPRDILSAAPKAAIETLIYGLAREEGRHGVRANCLGPGYIAAGLGASTVHDHTQAYVDKMVRAVPLKRAGTVEEIADVAVFLLSQKARYVTGVSIPVAGGLQLA